MAELEFAETVKELKSRLASIEMTYTAAIVKSENDIRALEERIDALTAELTQLKAQVYQGASADASQTKKVGENLAAGDLVTFGTQGGAPLEWQVLAVEADRALLITDKAIAARAFHGQQIPVTWAECDMRQWLNGPLFGKLFSMGEQERILETELAGAEDAPATQDRLFCLSDAEAEELFDGNEARICKPTAAALTDGAWTDNEGACRWWLRTPGKYPEMAGDIANTGALHGYGWCVDHAAFAVRPALWLKL